MANSPDFFLLISVIVFSLGLIGLTLRRNPLVMFMSIELMLNAASLAFLTFARFTPFANRFAETHQGGMADGPVFAFIVIILAAAEAVVGLAIIITIFRERRVVDVDALSALKG